MCLIMRIDFRTIINYTKWIFAISRLESRFFRSTSTITTKRTSKWISQLNLFFYEFCKNREFSRSWEKKLKFCEMMKLSMWLGEMKFFCVLGKFVFWVWDFYLTGKSIWFWFISSYQKWTRFRFTYRMGLCPPLKFQMSHEWIMMTS